MGDDGGPMITALLDDGPLSGTETEVSAVEGRPPKTIDVDGPGDARSRYCLADWEQSGHSAVYSFLYEVATDTSDEDDARQRAARGHDRGAEMHDHNAELLERHGASRAAARERADAQTQRDAAASERSDDHDG